jgi:hypothetical protein
MKLSVHRWFSSFSSVQTAECESGTLALEYQTEQHKQQIETLPSVFSPVLQHLETGFVCFASAKRTFSERKFSDRNHIADIHRSASKTREVSDDRGAVRCKAIRPTGSR